MCLLFFSYKSTPGYQLVIAANRDEFVQRPTAPLSFIDQGRHILAGLDLLGGGTWLGVNRDGKIAALTNYRGKEKKSDSAPSRGNILRSYLSTKIDAVGFLEKLADKASQYDGFNLILGEGAELFYFNNLHNNSVSLEPGFYGVSNHFLDTPWPKVCRGKTLLRPVMVETEYVDPEKIFVLLKDNHHPLDELLPDTGVGLEWERLLGTIFIRSPEYGTRSSAVITIGYDGEVTFAEMTYDYSKGSAPAAVRYSFLLQGFKSKVLPPTSGISTLGVLLTF